MNTDIISKIMDESCEYQLGDKKLYTAAYPAYHAKIVSRMIVENDVDDEDWNVSTPYEIEYGCIRLGRIDYITATTDELEEI